MKKIFYKSAFLAVLALGVGSCKDEFLDLDNPQSLSLTGTITDIPSLTNAATGVYNYFQAVDYYNRTFILVPELIGDNVFISRQNVGFYLNYDNLAVAAADGNAVGAWANMYGVVSNANLAIAGGEALTLPEAAQVNANQIIGEMYAARALAYFDLVRLFARPYNHTPDGSHPGVPVVTVSGQEVVSPARSTVAQVYDQIIRDFEKSITLMTVQRKNGHFTPGAAKALLAKVYLYKEDWANAERLASEVIASGTYSLVPNAQYVNSWGADFTSESLLEIVNIPVDRAAVNSIGFFFLQGAYGDALATEDLYNTYTATDVRRRLIQVGRRGNAENPAYIVLKYPKGLSSQDDNIKVIRLAEVYLIRAEARAAQPGKEAQAQADLNMVVQRADPSAPAITLTGQALMNRIITERRKELAFEGNRLFDLTRKKMDVNHIQSNRNTVIPHTDNRLVLPIPQNELNANPNIEPNPGY